MRRRDKKKKAKKLRLKRIENEVNLKQKKLNNFSDTTYWNIISNISNRKVGQWQN